MRRRVKVLFIVSHKRKYIRFVLCWLTTVCGYVYTKLYQQFWRTNFFLYFTYQRNRAARINKILLDHSMDICGSKTVFSYYLFNVIRYVMYIIRKQCLSVGKQHWLGMHQFSLKARIHKDLYLIITKNPLGLNVFSLNNLCTLQSNPQTNKINLFVS